MLTVMGVVIGFVISYRVMSGYDCYWMSRTAWTDVICNARTMAHLIWYHIPPRLTLPAAFTDPENSRLTVASAVPPPPGAAAPALLQASSSGVSTLTSCLGVSTLTSASSATASTTSTSTLKVSTHATKRPSSTPAGSHASETSIHQPCSLFAVSLKHHLRGELGIYYEDLYDLVRPLHDFTDPENPRPPVVSAVPPPLGAAAPSPPQAQAAASGSSVGVSTSTSTSTSSTSNTSTSTSTSGVSTATLKVGAHTTKRPSSTSASGHALQTSLHQPLLPASNPAPEDGVLRRVSLDMIPFAGVLTGVGAWVRGVWGVRKDNMGRHRVRGVSSKNWLVS
ncbi:hypothetical protein B0H14DRAFT_3747093 [Mycena olivaceomarginata]|nr:hypothetical protein B0H14DRAFT_3747093 [Mycena olivaceomarginata]